MQPTDVYSVTAGSDTAANAFEGQAVNGRARLKSIYFGGSAGVNNAAALFELRDGTAVTDTVLLKLACSGGSEVYAAGFFRIPGNGILFANGIYLDAEAEVGPVTMVVQGGAPA